MQGYAGTTIAEAWIKEAPALEPGTKLYRYFRLDPANVQKMLTVEPGTVLTNLSANPASHVNGLNADFGEHKLELIALPGAKAMQSYGSGSYGSEKETSLLPYHRFVVHKVRKRKNGGLKIKAYLLPP